jgi:hypothetical protein
LTSGVRCDCGCGLGHDDDEVGDDVVDFCIEEAVTLRYEQMVAAEMEADEQPPLRPGEITDPVMQQAMANAKRMHEQMTGVRT